LTDLLVIQYLYHPMDAAAAPQSSAAPRGRNELVKLAVGALGVVYGDIGTSPLYSVRACFGEHKDAAGRVLEPLARSHDNVLGIMSLIFWSLILVVVVKYLTFIMRADNNGEGGILALLALVAKKDGKPRMFFLIALGLFGAALLYGDGIITPAISVLSAVEGLAVKPIEEAATEGGILEKLVVPLTCVILVCLFLVQKRGTARVGAVFGPTMAVWFVTIGALGIPPLVHHPEVFAAVLPTHAVAFLVHHGTFGFFVLGSVVLCITGGEALYADMGHFGQKPIKWAWYALVLPSLMLNYFGQGAILLSEKGALAIKNPFYALAPAWFHYPLVGIATIATVIASQALISGAYSLTQQAVQLGYWPRVTIRHTSGVAEGQIYVPEINYGLMVACVALVLGFRHSDDLAAAYGIAVTGTMSITTILFFVLVREKWKWGMAKALALCGLFLAIDLLFFSANTVKILEGGWVPLGIAALVFTVMVTWKRGRAELGKAIASTTLPLKMFLEDMARAKPQRVKGTAVFMTSNPDAAPPVLLHHYKHNKVLHEQVVCLSILTHHVPEVPPAERLDMLNDLGEGVWQVRAQYGFMQAPSVPEIMQRCSERGLVTNKDDTSFFLGRETLVITDKPGMARWRKILFAFLSRNARPANAFFQIPPNRVVEFGAQIEL
jgi:KUP system potassium uptake protein